MSELTAIATALGARVTGTARGAILSFQQDGDWYTIDARERPHLELTMRSPELAGLAVHVDLGRETLLGAAGPGAPRAADQRWKVRGRCDLFDEAPWPDRELPPPEVPLGDALAVVVSALTYGVAFFDRLRPGDPPARYVLTVADQAATIERRSSESDHDLAIGAALRLVQLVTRPVRRRRAREDAELEADRRRPRGGAPYR